MSLSRGIGNAEYLKKKIPKNAKYEHVKTKLDTGCSLNKYMERLEDIRRNYRYRKDEIFKRLKATTFAQLILQVASVSDSKECEIDCASQDPHDSVSVVSEVDSACRGEQPNGSPENTSLLLPLSAGDHKDSCQSVRSTLLSVISGVGELTLERTDVHTHSRQPPDCLPAELPYPDCPYLLLDVREREQYDLCHIISAHSFPIATLARTMNPYTKEVLEYKNAPGKIIIVYDEDERIASQAATTMCERGFENLFMLCGGLKVIAQKFPKGMTTGSFPTACLPPAGPSKRRALEPQRPAEKRWTFTPEELTAIQAQMEQILVPMSRSNRQSSRLSTGSVRSKASSHHSSSTVSRRAVSKVHSSRFWK